jgi:hypothetical protein
MAAVLITVSMVTASSSVTPFFLHEHGLPCRHEDAGKTEDRERAEVALQRKISWVKSNLIPSRIPTYSQSLFLPKSGHVGLVVFITMVV